MAKSKNNIDKAIQLMNRKLIEGLRNAAAVAARNYAADVSEQVGERPIPAGTKGPPGHPYRSVPGEYPFVDPDTDEGWHGFEWISFGVDEGAFEARSGLKEEGMHLYELSHDPEFTGPYGARKGMDKSYKEHQSEIAAAFIAAAKATK